MPNAFIERFNRTYREEVLDDFLWVSTQEVQQLSDAWLTASLRACGVRLAAANGHFHVPQENHPSWLSI